MATDRVAVQSLVSRCNASSPCWRNGLGRLPKLRHEASNAFKNSPPDVDLRGLCLLPEVGN